MNDVKKNKSIRRLMWDKGISQVALAKEMGVSSRWLCVLLNSDLPEWRKKQIADAIERLENHHDK